MVGWIKMPLGTEVSLCPGDIVCWIGIQLPPQKRHSPQFSVHVYCGQTAVCVRISLGPEVGLSLGDIVLDGDPAPPRKKGHSPTQFLVHVYCGQTAGWIKILYLVRR